MSLPGLGRKITVHSLQRRGVYRRRRCTGHEVYWGKIKEKDRLEAVGTRGLLRLEVRHSIPDGVGSHNIVEMFHDSGGEGRCMVIEWHMVGGRLGKMSPE